MRWHVISGTWRETRPALVRAAERIRIFIPGTPERYFAHLCGAVREKQYPQLGAAAVLVTQLEDLRRRNPSALVGSPEDLVIDRAAYFCRNTAEVEIGDVQVAFPLRNEVGPGYGTWDTVAKARRRGLPCEIHPFEYSKYEP